MPKKTPLPRVAVETLKDLQSYGVDDYVFPSKPTAKWPDPKNPYRWDMGNRFAPSSGHWESKTSASTTSGTPDRRFCCCRACRDIVRKITGHRSRELERYQKLYPPCRTQTVDLFAQVLLSDPRTDTPAPDEKQDDANLFENGGVDGTRTRDLRRDRPAF